MVVYSFLAGHLPAWLRQGEGSRADKITLGALKAPVGTDLVAAHKLELRVNRDGGKGIGEPAGIGCMHGAGLVFREFPASGDSHSELAPLSEYHGRGRR